MADAKSMIDEERHGLWRIEGYERGLREGFAHVTKADKKTAQWRKLALIWSGVAMALLITVLIESAALYFKR